MLLLGGIVTSFFAGAVGLAILLAGFLVFLVAVSALANYVRRTSEDTDEDVQPEPRMHSGGSQANPKS
jgi:hypothetical protein